MTDIQWTHPPGFKGVTLNPVVGCRPISAGCLNCYAATMAGQRLQHMPQSKEKYSGLTVLNNGRHAFNGVLRLDRDAALKPLSWREPRCIFECSMGDLFAGSDSDLRAGAEQVPVEYLALLFAVALETPQHRYLLLTKRPDRAAQILNDPTFHHRVASVIKCNFGETHGGTILDGVELSQDLWPIANVAIGCSVSTQADADRDIPHLLECPAAMRFVSYEPALEEVDFREWINTDAPNCPECGHPDEMHAEEGRTVGCQAGDGTDESPICLCRRLRGEGRHRCQGEPRHNHSLHWLIVGGESGPNARPFDLAWARSAVEQAQRAGIACFVKQMGSNPHKIRRDWTDEYVSEPIKLTDRHGGDPAEWPDDLRVRQWPEAFFAQEGTGHRAQGTGGDA